MFGCPRIIKKRRKESMKIKNKPLYILAFILLFLVTAQLMQVKYREKMHDHPKIYCYDTARGVSNGVLAIFDLNLRDSLINYYKLVEKRENPYFNFPLHVIRTDRQVYLLGYEGPDSLLAKIYIDYDGSDEVAFIYKTGVQ